MLSLSLFFLTIVANYQLLSREDKRCKRVYYKISKADAPKLAGMLMSLLRKVSVILYHSYKEQDETASIARLIKDCTVRVVQRCKY